MKKKEETGLLEESGFGRWNCTSYCRHFLWSRCILLQRALFYGTQSTIHTLREPYGKGGRAEIKRKSRGLYTGNQSERGKKSPFPERKSTILMCRIKR